MVAQVSWDSRLVICIYLIFTLYLPSARVGRLLPRGMVRRIDDFHDFWGEPFQHHFQALPQGHPRRPAALAAAAHADEKRAFTDLHQRNLPAVVGDGTVDLQGSGSASEVCARMLIGCSASVGFTDAGFVAVLSTDRASDIFDALRRSALARGAQVVKRMDAAVLAIAPMEAERVVAHTHDLARAHIRAHRLRIEQLAAAHLLNAERAMTR